MKHWIISVATLVVLICVWVWDLWARLTQRPEQSVSAVILDLSRQSPLIPLLIGLLLGHLFWPQ